MMAPDLPVEEEEDNPPPKPRIQFVVRVRDTFRRKIHSLPGKISSFCQSYYASLNYRDYHWAYFSLLWLISGIFLIAFRKSHESVSCVDCFFLAISALTGTGLAPVIISSLSVAQQVILCFNFFLGSPLVISLATVWIRIRSFDSKFNEIIHNSRQQSAAFSATSSDTETSADSGTKSTTGSVLQGSDIEKEEVKETAVTSKTDETPPVPLQEVVRSSSWKSYWKHITRRMTSRNSAFHGLTREERESLVYVEYKSQKFILKSVLLYIIVHQVLGSLALSLYFALHEDHIIQENDNHVNPWWLGIFISISAFNNAGMSLMDQNMVPFKKSAFTIYVMNYLVLAGNTAFPIFLRFAIWVMLRSLPRSPSYDEKRATLEYTLRYPRRVYTHLFPSKETWYLLVILVFLNCVDLVTFEVAERNNDEIKDLAPGVRLLDGLFQTLCVRISGFNIVTVAALSSGLLSLYCGMMYISSMPVTLTIRTTNVYEERSLGIYTIAKASNIDVEHGEPDNVPIHNEKGKRYFIGKQLTEQLGYDMFALGCGLVAIIFVESRGRAPDQYNIFYVVFEVISAYANIGLSMGSPVPTEAFSFCGTWHASSKIILTYLMLRGRHRTLPVSIDRAVQLPEENLGSREEADEREREHQLDLERERERKEQ